MNLNLGTGLFSDASKAIASGMFKVQYISFDLLLPNDEEHGFSLDGIEELAESIADVGLEQNLVVEDTGDGFYRILTGRRRYYAIRLLLEQGNAKYKTVPCVVKRLSDIDLPLDDKTKRIYAIVTTNAEQRKPTAADTAEMIRKLNIVYDELEKNGAKPKGRRRDYIAAELGISPATVGRYEYIDKNANDSAKAALKEGKSGLRETLEETKNKNCAHVSTIKENGTEASGINNSNKTERAVYILRKDAVFVLPYNDFAEERYELKADDYKKAMKIIQEIRRKYKKLANLLNR